MPVSRAYLLFVRSTWHGARQASAGAVTYTVVQSLTLWGALTFKRTTYKGARSGRGYTKPPLI